MSSLVALLVGKTRGGSKQLVNKLKCLSPSHQGEHRQILCDHFAVTVRPWFEAIDEAVALAATAGLHGVLHFCTEPGECCDDTPRDLANFHLAVARN